MRILVGKLKTVIYHDKLVADLKALEHVYQESLDQLPELLLGLLDSLGGNDDAYPVDRKRRGDKRPLQVGRKRLRLDSCR